MDVASSYRQIYQENRETYESFLKEREEDIVVHEVLTCYIPKYIDYFETIYIVISRPDKSIISRAEEILLCAKEEFNNSILNIRADYISYIYTQCWQVWKEGVVTFLMLLDVRIISLRKQNMIISISGI